MPLRLIGCGEPLALSVTLTLALLPPADTGLKLRDKVQLAFTAKLAPQVFDRTKSSVWPLAREIDINDTIVLPLLS